MKKKIHEYLKRQYMLSKEYEIYHYSNKDFDNVNLHHHDFYECYFFISGDVSYLIEGTSYKLKPGDLILIDSKELHQVNIHNKEIDYERIVLWISKSLLKEISTDEVNLSLCFEGKMKINIIRSDDSNPKQVRTILDKLLELEDYEGIGKSLLYKAYITEFMININNLIMNNLNQVDIGFNMRNLSGEIVDYINNHLYEDINIEKLSEEFYLSKFHLIRKFKKDTGTTIHRYIVQKKLIEAKDLILKNIPITSVYKECGFGDYSNFFRAFKKEYGVTPKQYYDIMLSLDKDK